MGQALDASGNMIDLPPVDPALKEARTAAAQQRKDFRAVQDAAAKELTELKAGAIDYFIRGEAYPDALKTHVAAVTAVLDAKIEDPLPELPARPVIAAKVEPV